MVISADIENGFEEKPSKLRLDAVEVLTHSLHEGLTPIREFTILNILLIIDLVKHLELHLHLLLDSKQLVSEVLLLISNVMTENNKLAAKRQDCLRQVCFIELHLHCVNLLLKVTAICCARH